MVSSQFGANKLILGGGWFFVKYKLFSKIALRVGYSENG